MSAAREEILGRIRRALTDVPASAGGPDADELPRDYGRGTERDPGALAALLDERIRAYAAHAERVADEAQVAGAVRAACARLGIERLRCAPGVPARWRPDGLTLEADETGGVTELDRVDGVLTGCGLAIAQTGTLVLDAGPRSGRRALTLVPDRHICVVEAAQIVERVPQAIAALESRVTGDRAPITFVSGSSATSDIELERVEGVHGPRELHVIIVG